ncbi:MAG: hypothetical protein KXJ61_18000 [Hydrogenophaga sp.]|uniref:hypothetical protein n=1 Tax=Hydrogenophaga sp. TaxID=1904254 RepID=UPI001DFADC30|nr:hypothetical protein [Hydrogenophaga sp.]MBW0172115.1 hypothetical protein [Hydrogenophaga sp.]MBW0186198.1 hypothetical protein [Hydrogenophaga sp.]
MSRNRARKATVTVGGLAGALASGSSAWASVRVGARIGLQVGAGLGIVAGPGGSVLGAVAGAMLAALAGAAAGCAAGVALGEFLDDKLLNNHHCLDCGHCFGSPPTQTSGAQPPRCPTNAHGYADFHGNDREPSPPDSNWEDDHDGGEGFGFRHRAPRD